MSAATLEPAAKVDDCAAVNPAPAARNWLGSWLLLGSLWLVLINQLRVDWAANPQYGYGWLVPLLAAYLFWSRWPSRPEPGASPGWLPLGLASVVVALAFLPTRVVREATPEWSAVNWALALETVALTLAATAWMGGWKSLRHFAWPIGFFLVAVAWPVHFELPLTQGLMRSLASLTTELLGWFGVPAIAEGNLIRLRTEIVGVDEACSGVRSLQSMLMASLFLGELNRLPLLARLGLVAAGLSIAVICNVIRALVLVTVAIRHGLSALEQWHDPAGFSILAISFLALCLVVKLLPSSRLAEASAPRHPWRPLPASIWAPALAWLALTEAATEAWYRSHESPSSRRVSWSVRWPEARAGFHDLEISPKVRTTLAFSEGREARWEGPDGGHWQMFAFRWHAGRSSTMEARQHRPEICLPAAGRTLVAEHPALTLEAGDLRIPFRVYDFDDHGEPLHVFFCLWEVASRDLGGHLLQDTSRISRLQRVFAGQRNLGQQSIEVIITGMRSHAAAEAAFNSQMPAFLTRPQSSS